MGATSSQVRDRNEKRFQRNTLIKIEADIDKLERSIAKFKGLEENDRYKDLQNHIQHLKSDLLRRSRRIHPQLKSYHNRLLDRMDELLQLLIKTLSDNREGYQQAQLKGPIKSPTESRKLAEIVEAEEPVDDLESDTGVHKRQIVELKLMKVVNDSEEIDNSQIRNPVQDKKQSIIKVGGIPVMPGEVMSTIAKQSNRISRRYSQRYSVNNEENILKQINDIIEKLEAIEVDIYNFVGNKGSRKYEDIKNQLNLYLIDLNGMPVKEDELDQLKRAKDYVGSCLNFLDQRAVDNHANKDEESLDSENENEDVFESKKNSEEIKTNGIGTLAQDDLQRFTKITTV